MVPAPALFLQARRDFFRQCALGVGTLGLLSLLSEDERSRVGPAARDSDPLARKRPHIRAKAKNVIFLFMNGGPSQLELFDYKPVLQARNGQALPDSFLRGKRFAFMDNFAREAPRLLGTRRNFARHGRSAAYVSELLPHTADIVDDIAIVRSMVTDSFDHQPAIRFLNTGSIRAGQPSTGAWVTYGLGSESRDLPGFVVLYSGRPIVETGNWGSGFLPTIYQGVPLRGTGEPILNLASPEGVTPARQRRALDALRGLNAARFEETGDPEIATRIAAYEAAYRLQVSAPELLNLSGETKETLALYGAEPGKSSFANNCLLARRLVERGVRFVQLYQGSWDHHGFKNNNLNESLEQLCREMDQPVAALVKDLKQRGLLDQTLVIWGGEFGRTPMGQVGETIGRNHHPDAFTMWLAGGGVKAGLQLGATDELGFHAVEDRVHVHDLQATILDLLGLDHKQLTYRFQGRDFRLTDTSGEVVDKLLA